MNNSLRLGLFLASLIALGFVLFSVKSKKLNIKYSIVWLLWAVFSFLMAAFPEVFYEFTKLLGIEMPSNGVFLIMITLLYGLLFYVYVMISKHNEEIIKLSYEVAKLKKELDEKSKNKK